MATSRDDTCPVTNNLEIRPAAPSEYDEIGELCVTSYSAGGHLDPDDDYAHTLRDAAARAASAEVLVAYRDGSIVGTVTICPVGSTFSEIGQGKESEFRFLAVAPRAWRTGVGEALVTACEARAVERGAPAHVICVIDKNAGGHRFYQRLGFSRMPERDWTPVEGVFLQAYRREVPHG